MFICLWVSVSTWYHFLWPKQFLYHVLQASLLMINSLSSYIVRKVFILPLFLKDIFVVHRSKGWQVFSFSALKFYIVLTGNLLSSLYLSNLPLFPLSIFFILYIVVFISWSLISVFFISSMSLLNILNIWITVTVTLLMSLSANWYLGWFHLWLFPSYGLYYPTLYLLVFYWMPGMIFT